MNMCLGEIGIFNSITRLYLCELRPRSLQSCQTLCNPMDQSSPGFSVLGILQARILEWVAVPYSMGSS